VRYGSDGFGEMGGAEKLRFKGFGIVGLLERARVE